MYAKCREIVWPMRIPLARALLLGSIECMRYRLLLPKFTVSVCQPVHPAVCHAAELGGGA